MAQNLFTKKITCKVCGNNFRKVNDRSKIKYIDGGYARKISDCDRNAIEEDLILEAIERYCFKNGMEYSADKSFIRDFVKKIEVDGQKIEIFYSTGEKSIISPNMVKI